MALFPGLPRWAGTRMVKPIWILLKQETVSGSGIRWAICNSALSSRQTTTPAPHLSVFYRLDALRAAQPTASKHWMDTAFMSCKHKMHSKCYHYTIFIHMPQRLSFLDCLTGQCNITVFMTLPNNEPMHTCSRVSSGQVGQFLSSEFKILFKNFH